MKTFIKFFFGLVILAVFAGTLFFLYNKSKQKPVVLPDGRSVVTTIIKKAVATGSIVPRKKLKSNPRFPASFKKYSWMRARY